MYERSRSLLLLVVVSIPSSSIAAEPVTTCGQRVKDGILTQDVDCTGFPYVYSLLVERSLLLDGHTITTNGGGIVCAKPSDTTATGKCTIVGPGTIRGSDVYSDGINGRKVSVDGVTFEGLSNGVGATKATVSNSMMTGIFPAGAGGALVGASRVATVVGSSLSGADGWGVAGGRRVIVENSTVTDNGWDGVTGGRVDIRNSTVTGNSLSCDMTFFCGPAPTQLCSDVSARRLRLDETTVCDTSLVQEKYCPSSPLDYRPGPNHGVCTQD